MTLASSADKLSKTFDDLMSTPIDFSAYIMNGMKITNLTQETLVGPAFKLLKGTRTNFTKLEYDFEECYKALSEKLDWENPEGGDYPFDLTKPLPLVMNGNRQMVLVDYFFNNDLKYLQGRIPTMTYTTSTMKTKAAQYDLPCIEEIQQRKTFYAYARGLESSHDVYYTKRILEVTWVENRLTNLSGDDVSDFAIALRMFTRSMVIQKESKIFNWESKVTRIRSTSPSQKLPNPTSGKGTHTLHIKTLKDSFMLTTKGETDMIEKILSGSTCLESLELKDCYGYRRIDFTSKSVKKLVFLEYNSDAAYEEDYIDCIKINALYISSLTIKEVFRGLLKSLVHFEDITLGDHCSELLSRLKASSDTSNDDRAEK
ncbi:hypothetical protein Tco_0711802 [Tanacetum coccineum]